MDIAYMSTFDQYIQMLVETNNILRMEDSEE